VRRCPAGRVTRRMRLLITPASQTRQRELRRVVRSAFRPGIRFVAFLCGDRVAAGEPAREIDVGAFLRAERLERFHPRTAANGAAARQRFRLARRHRNLRARIRCAVRT